MAGQANASEHQEANPEEGGRQRVVFYDVDLTLIDQIELPRDPAKETPEERVKRVACHLNPALVELASDPNTIVVLTTSWDMSQTREGKEDIFRRTIADALCSRARKRTEDVKIVVTGSEYMEKDLGFYYDKVVGPFEDLMIEYAGKQGVRKTAHLAERIQSIHKEADEFLRKYNEVLSEASSVEPEKRIVDQKSEHDSTMTGGALDRLRIHINAMLFAIQTKESATPDGRPKKPIGKKSMYEHVISMLSAAEKLPAGAELMIFDDNWSAIRNSPRNVPDTVRLQSFHVCTPTEQARLPGGRGEDTEVMEEHRAHPAQWSIVNMRTKQQLQCSHLAQLGAPRPAIHPWLSNSQSCVGPAGQNLGGPTCTVS